MRQTDKPIANYHMQEIHKLYIEPSSLCNLNCKVCFRNNWFEEMAGNMTPQTVSHVLDILKSNLYSSAFFGGIGEPLMHQDVFRMISTVTSCGKQAELITNASLLDKIAITKLKDYGLDTLWISVDGFSKEIYERLRRGSLYEKMIDSLSEFHNINGSTKLGITFVMMKENLCELEKINEFADRYGVDFLNLSHVIPGKPLKKSDAVYDMPYRIGKMHRFDPSERYFKPQDFCPFVQEKTCFIRFDGEVTPCMQLLHNSYTYLNEEKRKIYFHSYGNINKMNIEDIWNSDEYCSFRKRVINFEFPCCTICLGCQDRKENKTDCMFNQFPTCGACLWAQGLIRCP